ncbi:MAG: hypothetical protein P8Z31_12420 [Gammaproteobacteria bacterium]
MRPPGRIVSSATPLKLIASDASSASLSLTVTLTRTLQVSQEASAEKSARL